MDLSEIFKTLGDETRLRILNLLSKHELCLCIIKEVMGILQPNASKHISRLKVSGIIGCRKISQWCFFCISDRFKQQYGPLYELLENVWRNGANYIEDARRLEDLIATNDCCRELLRKGGKKQAVELPYNS